MITLVEKSTNLLSEVDVPVDDAFGPIVVPTMMDELVRQLRRYILSGAVKPGERLVEERLCERFGVSRPPLRESLRVLQRDGLVQSTPRRGFRVVSLDANDIREIYSLRMNLERMAIELGVPVADDSLLVPMRDAIQRMRDAASTGSRDDMVQANSDFHYAIAALPGHRRLLRTYESLRMQMTLCMAFNLELRMASGDPSNAVTPHQELLDCIEKGDRDLALQRLANHGQDIFLGRIDELIPAEKK